MRLSRRAVLVSALTALPALSAEVPRPSPDFVINMPGGAKVSVASFRGKVVALAFISTSCPSCIALTQVMSGIQAEYEPRGVQVLQSAMDPQGANVLEFIRRHKPSFPLGWNDPVDILNFLEVPVITPGYVPKMVFIDRKGIIQAQHEAQPAPDPFFGDPAATVRAALDKLLGPPPAAPKKKK